MSAWAMPSGPARAAAICGICAAVIITGSAQTRYVCTVMASGWPSAAVISPRTAGKLTVSSRWSWAIRTYVPDSKPWSWISRPANRDITTAMHSSVAPSRRPGSARGRSTRRTTARGRGGRGRGGRGRDGRPPGLPVRGARAAVLRGREGAAREAA